MMASLRARLDRFWFSEVPAARLAWIRIITGIYTSWYLLHWRERLVDTAHSPPATFRPVGVTTLMSGPISPDLYDTLFGVAVFLSGCFLFGIWYRVLGPIFGVLFLWIVTYSTSWSMVYHTENMLVMHVLILSIAPSANALSVDVRWTRSSPRLKSFGLASDDPGAHYRYSWPIRCLQLGATFPYVVAGVAKIRSDAGWSWALGENLRDQITMNGLYYDVYYGSVSDVTYHVYEWQYGLLFMFAATMTLIVELGAPLALLHRYAGYLFVVNVMAMHWGILWLMDIPFRYQLFGFAFACFFEWERIAAFIGARLARFRKSGHAAPEGGAPG